MGITRPCTKWNTLVRDVRDLPRAVNEAFSVAVTGRPGPVLVDLPKDVTASRLLEPTDSTPRLAARAEEKAARERVSSCSMDAAQVERLARLINDAKRPIIYAGQGVISGNAVALLRELAAAANIPVTTTLLGMGAFDETDDRSLHMLGMHGSAYANYAMQVRAGGVGCWSLLSSRPARVARVPNPPLFFRALM